jgi:hypothetical protein
MSEQQLFCKQLLLLVGSNPLPNFIAALILKPESIRLFYSPESEPVKDYLKKKLKDRLENIEIIDTRIDNATDPSKVRKAFASISADAHLHYTGGTKTMAAHARLAFRDAGGTDEKASYLDERNAVLRFDDGYEIPESKWDFELTIADVLWLHGVEDFAKHEISKLQCIEQNLKGIATAVFNNPTLIGNLNNISVDKYSELIPELNSQVLLENKDRFLKGVWLEDWVGVMLQQCGIKSEICISLKSMRSKERGFEADVVLIRRHRLYVISCTTQSKLKDCKFKLFEVAMRARQLGGDLARSALVCMIHGFEEGMNLLKIDQLKKDVMDIWDASNTPRVFGLDDLREWAGIHGEPNMGTLQKWLES